MVNTVAQRITLTKKQAFALCQDLLHGFSSAHFQMQLKELMGGKKSVPGHLPGRSELAFSVQSRVLPKYGLPATEAGVNVMFDAIHPLLNDSMMHQMKVLIEDKLGMRAETSAEKLMSLFRSDSPPAFAWQEASSVGQELLERLSHPEVVLSMIKELVEAFSTPDFMSELQNLSAGDASGRKNLAFTVQKAVLPKYGIPGTSDGVEFMLTVIAPYLDDWMLVMEGDMLKKMLREIENSLNAADKLPCLLESRPRTAVIEKPRAQSSAAAGMTKDKAFKMVWELLEAFSSFDFQQQLAKLKANKPNTIRMRPTSQSPKHIPGRSKLALTVQSYVLPKYGIPGTLDGEKMMREAISSFQGDWMLQEMLWAIDVQLAKNTETTLEWLLGFLRKHAKSAVQVSLTKVEMLSVTKELLEGFSRCDFQEKVEEFLSKDESAYDMPGRMELALTVQSEVLPKYGIPGTHEGVAIMLEAMLPYTDDEKVQELHELMLGAISPFVHDWAQLMDVLSLEDMIEVIDGKLDEMAEVDETEDSMDKFACLDLNCEDTLPEEFDDGKKISWCRQITGNSEASTACPWDGPDSRTWGRQISGFSEGPQWNSEELESPVRTVAAW
mmetsp:Transcript_162664/g.312317  ORF Transcript_162664/g.312317 Transcript_162664/m.312317 type:complete len:610 (+) Transcript_162664:122-1951(+)